MGGLNGLGTSPTPGFPGGSFGREEGRGGGGGGAAVLQEVKGVAGRAGEEEPLAVPVPLLELGPGDDTTVL